MKKKLQLKKETIDVLTSLTTSNHNGGGDTDISKGGGNTSCNCGGYPETEGGTCQIYCYTAEFMCPSGVSMCTNVESFCMHDTCRTYPV